MEWRLFPIECGISLNNNYLQPKYLFVNKYYVDGLINIIEFNNYNSVDNKEQELSKLLFYLNLYRNNIKILYQEKYYNNIDKKNILNEIENNIFFENIEESQIYKEISNPKYYWLSKFVYTDILHKLIINNKYNIDNVNILIEELMIDGFIYK